MSHNTKETIRVLTSRRSLGLISLCLCFIFSAVILMNLQRPRATTLVTLGSIPVNPYDGSVKKLRVPAGTQTGAPTPAAAQISAPNRINAEADANSLGLRDLLIPVASVASNQLRDSFYDSRSDGRVHQALDIMAPRDTPVLAADDGRVMKLRQSERGGTMLYQADVSGTYVFYYGHLSGYADGICEGKNVKRGDLIAYVGDTGNAGAGNYHLHFGISKMAAAGKWYGGEAINPYPLLQGKLAQSIGGK